MSENNSRGPSRRRHSLARTTPTPEASSRSIKLGQGVLSISSHYKAVLELQRISHLFEDTSFISEAEFVIHCKTAMNMLQYSQLDDVDHQCQTLLVDVIENAVTTFLIRILPLVFQELIAPTSLLHPISPPMILSLLEIVDAHVTRYGHFGLQLRMTAVHLLIQENENATLAFSMCQMLPKIHPKPKWQPVMNPVKANPVSNVGGSISLPEIHPPVFPESPSPDCSSLFGSPIPSLSSLLNCTASSSTSLPRFYQYELEHANTITQSVSQPIVSVSSAPILVNSFSAPSLQNLPVAKIPVDAIIPPVIASEGALIASLPEEPAEEYLFSPSLFSPDRHAYNDEDSVEVLGRPDIYVELAAAEDHLIPPSEDTMPYPQMAAFTSQDDISQLISGPDVGEEPPSPSLFTPDSNFVAGADFSISIGPPLAEVKLPIPDLSNEAIPLSPLSNQASSPLSSPPQIVVEKDSDIFRNTFEIEVQKRPPSPYNKRLRSASNNPQPGMRRVDQQITRSVSASNRRAAPLDPDLAALTLPPPPHPSASSKVRLRKPRALSTSRRDKPIVIDDDDEPTPSRHRSQRSTSASMDKENK